jgi:hypothetical protein
MKAPETLNVGMSCEINVGSWPWVTLRKGPGERKLASESWRAGTWSSPVHLVSATLHGRKQLMKVGLGG